MWCSQGAFRRSPLQQIYASDSLLVLMLVSTLWYNTVTGTWVSLKLGTTTPKDAVTHKLERVRSFLDVVVDTEIDRGRLTLSAHDGEALSLRPAWHRPTCRKTWSTVISNNAPMPSWAVLVHSRSRSLVRCRPSEMSPLLDHLGTSASEELTIVEINSANVTSFLVPNYSSIFRSVTVLSLNSPGLPNPVDLLPHLRQLESLTASHLLYHSDANLPFAHTLRHLRLRSVSIRWMSGRTFHALESCTLIFIAMFCTHSAPPSRTAWTFL